MTHILLKLSPILYTIKIATLKFRSEILHSKRFQCFYDATEHRERMFIFRNIRFFCRVLKPFTFLRVLYLKIKIFVLAETCLNEKFQVKTSLSDC